MENKTSILFQRYELGRLLGQGTFAKVHYARNLKTGQSVAIKMIDKEKVFKVGMIDQIKREISVMRLVRHPHIVQLYEVMASKTKIYFVLEFVKGGELFNKVAKGKLKEDVARKYFQQLISAVDFCHSRGVYHRDLKPENLLLDENEDLKISDFGLSALTYSKRQDGLLHTTCGTPAYVAPEVINKKGYDGAKADIWSCGVILFVLLSGYLPFHDSNLMDMYKKITKAEFKFPNFFPSDVRRLLSKILDPNPNTRISIVKIKENSWFKKGYKPPQDGEVDTDEASILDVDAVFATPGDNVEKTAEQQPAPHVKPHCMNAFDIISLSSGFDLSGLFEDARVKEEERFTSRNSALTIISKLEEVAKALRFKIKKKDDGLVRIQAPKEGKKGVLTIDAEIYELTPSLYVVEMKKSNGDTMEYKSVCKNQLRPALKDIVWTWQGDKSSPQPQQQQQQLQLHQEQEQEQQQQLHQQQEQQQQ